MTRLASVSVDLDNKWSYMKIHGEDGWQTFPTYLDVVVDRLIEFSDRQDVSMTAFVVGQDAALNKNADAMAALGRSRFEIGNHSFHHEPWLHLQESDAVAAELADAHEVIAAATGKDPAGFRGHGFSISSAAVTALAGLGYSYDGSTLPTFIGPLARAFYLRGSDLGPEELKKRDHLFGKWTEGLRPIRPYLLDAGAAGDVLELPVTTIPLVRTPFHATYLFFLARYSVALSKAYFRTAVWACKVAGVEPSLLLHSLDFLGPEDVDGLDFFPGMDLSGSDKRALLADYMAILRNSFEVVPMVDHAQASLGKKLDRVAASALD